MIGLLLQVFEYINPLLVFVVCTVLFLYSMTRDKLTRKHFKQIFLYILVVYFVNIAVYILLFFASSKLSIYKDTFISMSFIFLLILTLLEVFITTVSTKEIILRSKKKEDLKDICSNVRNSVDMVNSCVLSSLGLYVYFR